MKTVQPLPPELYTREYYLHLCRGFEEFSTGTVSPILLRAFDDGAVSEGMKILDVGSGRGELAAMCAEAGCDVWAIDYSSEALAISRDYFEKNVSSDTRKRILLYRMNAKSLAFPSDFFDRVFMIDIVEHLYPEELDRVLSEVKRVARPGGRIVVHTAPNAWLIQPVYLAAGLLFGWTKQPYHVNEQSYLSLHRNLARMGGRIRGRISKIPGFFKLGVGSETSPGSVAGRLARLIDAFLDGPLATWLISHSPLKLVLGTNLWATVELPADEEGEGP